VSFLEHKAEIRLRYEETADMYDRRYRTIQRQKFDVFYKELAMGLSSGVIDIGCGTGLFFEFLDFFPKTAIGLDFSVNMLKIAKKKLKNSLIHWISADMEHLPFREALFDHVFLITSLQNVPNFERALKETFRICGHHGFVILSILKKKQAPVKLTSLQKEMNFQVIKKFNLEEIEDFIEILRKK